MSSLSRRAARRGRLTAVLLRLGRGRWFVRRLSERLSLGDLVVDRFEGVEGGFGGVERFSFFFFP
jgi:hypothetical protein